mgnify:CR=1 FL=1
MTEPRDVVRAFLEHLSAGDTARANALLAPDVEWRNTRLPTVRGAKVAEALDMLTARGVGVRVELHHGAATDVGLVREVNEDAFLVAPPVFVVADGMGGHDGGDVASAIVVEEFARLADAGYDPRRGAEVVAATLEECRRRIEAYGAEQRAAGQTAFSAGTTAVVGLLVEDDGQPQWLLANLGDSRAYRVEGGSLEQVTVDHSVVQELVDTGLITEAAQAEKILDDGEADVVLLARELLRNPYWPIHAQTELDGEATWPSPYKRVAELRNYPAPPR